jgi:hypothetical protein
MKPSIEAYRLSFFHAKPSWEEHAHFIGELKVPWVWVEERIDSKSIAVVPIHDWDGSGDTLVCSESTAYGLFQLHPHMHRQALLTHSKARI